MPENPTIAVIRQLIDDGRFQEAVDECRAFLFEDPQDEVVVAMLHEASAAMESDTVPEPKARPSSPVTRDRAEETVDPLIARLDEEYAAQPESGSEEADAAAMLPQEDRDRVDALIREGDALMEEGKQQEAIDVWSRIYIIDLNNPRAQKRIERARIALEEEQRKWDEQLQEGNELLERKEYEQALERFRLVLEASPNHAEALEAVDRVEQAKRGDQERADKTKQMMVRAAKLYREGQISEAVYTWEKVLDAEPGNERARQFLSEARHKLDEVVVGADRFTEAVPSHQARAAIKPRAGSDLISAAYQSSDDSAATLGVSKGRLPMFVVIAAVAALIAAAAVYYGLTRSGGSIDDEADDVSQTEQPTAEVPAAPVEDVILPVLDAATAASIDKQLSTDPGYVTARKAFAEGRYEDAVTGYKAVAAVASDNPLVTQQLYRSQYNAGVMALRGENVGRAIEHFSAAVTMEPSDTVAKRNLEAARRYASTKVDDRLRWYAQLVTLRR